MATNGRRGGGMAGGIGVGGILVIIGIILAIVCCGSGSSSC
jgi:hypothetical protein